MQATAKEKLSAGANTENINERFVCGSTQIPKGRFFSLSGLSAESKK
jgi:hypothetical protein